MSLSVTKEQLATAIANAGIIDTERVYVTRNPESIMTKCSVEAAMMLTFELASVLGLRPGVPGYREIIPRNASCGGDLMFSWTVTVEESILASVSELPASNPSDLPEGGTPYAA